MRENRDAPNVTLSIKQIGDANAQPVDFRERLIAFSYEDNAKLVDEATVTLDNWELDLFDNPLFRLHNEIDVAWGYHGDMTTPRRCVIVELSGGQLLTIKAHGQATWMNRVTKSRKWESVTRSEVVKKIAGEYGFGTDAYIEDTKVNYSQITQARCTDAQFIRSLASKEGFEFFISRGQLHFHRAKLDQQPAKTLVWAGRTHADDPDSVFVTFPNISEEIKGKVGAMAHKGLDPMTKKVTKASQSNEDHKESTLGSFIEVFDQRTGKSLGMVSKAASEHTSPTSAPTEAAAKREAAAKYRTSRKGHLKMSCTIVGDKDIGAHDLIVVSGIGTRLSGKWYVVKANHKPVGSGAYTTGLECTRDAHFGYSDPKRDVKAKGTLNQKEEASEDKLEEVEAIDRRTGQRKGTAYKPRH